MIHDKLDELHNHTSLEVFVPRHRATSRERRRAGCPYQRTAVASDAASSSALTARRHHNHSGRRGRQRRSPLNTLQYCMPVSLYSRSAARVTPSRGGQPSGGTCWGAVVGWIGAGA